MLHTVTSMHINQFWLEFHQNRLSGFRSVGGRNLPFPTDLAILQLIRSNQWKRANLDPHSPEIA